MEMEISAVETVNNVIHNINIGKITTDEIKLIKTFDENAKDICYSIL